MAKTSYNLVADFYHQQHDSLISFLYQRLGSYQDAADIAQQTYERLLAHNGASEVNNPRAYIFKTASNIAIDHIRQRKVRGEDDNNSEYCFDDLASDAAAPEEQLDYELTVEMLRIFISELPPKCRSAFLYYKFEECDYKDIARQLQVSESMVRKYVLRAVAYCRKRLDQCKDEALLEARHLWNGGRQ